MPVDRAYLKPRSVDVPPQGDFVFPPVVKIFESDTAAGLEALMDADFGIQQESITEFWVIESIQYSVSVIKLETGANDHMALYSALVWATKVEKV
jgi:hypothetical protein